jgi:hypothetical protein
MRHDLAIGQPLLIGKLCKANGYFMLCFPNKKTMTVHRCVAIAFHANPLGLREVKHKNGIKTDNRAEYLEGVSSSQNRIHAFENGMQERSRTTHGNRLGSKNKHAKLDESMINRFIADYKLLGSQSKVAEKYGIAKSTAGSIIRGRTWKHVKRLTQEQIVVHTDPASQNP